MTESFVTNPYPGLRPFETEEDYLFFGRDGQSEEILSRLRRKRFVAVVGTSGSGKSSLVRAGLLPYLYGGFMSGAGSHWRVAVMRPGGDPIRNLADALFTPSVLAPPDLSDEDAQQEQTVLEMTLRRSGLGLVEAVRQARLPAKDNVLMVVDQFEELFRFADPLRSSRNEEDAAAFVKLLLESATQTTYPIYVVITMRSDFIGDCARYRDLPEMVAGGLYLIPRMTRDQRRQAIERPAQVAEGSIAPRLMNRLLNDSGDSPDQLPILQHALMRTWDYWRRYREPNTPIDLDDYKAIGEMSEALSRHAEEAYAELPDERSRTIAKRMFQALTEKGDDNREIRRPTSLGAIAAIAGATVPEVISVIAHFRITGRSFLTPPANVQLTENSVIDISHESLIRGWGRLNKWVDEEAESAKVYQRLAETAALEAQGRAALWQGPDLRDALSWREREKPNPGWGNFYHPGFETAMGFLDRRAAARSRKVLVYGGLALCLVVWCAYLFYAHEHNRRRMAAEEARASLTATQLRQQQELMAANAKVAQLEHENDEEKMKQSQLEAEWVRSVSRSADVSRIELAGYAKDLTTQLDAMDPPERKIEAQGILGTVYTFMGEHEKSAQAYTALLLMHPDEHIMQEERAYEYILMGRADEAIADLNSYLRYDPHSYNAHENLCVALAIERRYREATVEAQKAIREFQFGSSNLFDSEIAPDIQRATGQTNLVATPATVHVTMLYELAILKAFAGDSGFAKALDEADAVARREGYAPPAKGTNVVPPTEAVDPFLLGIEWAWLSARAQNIDPTRASREDYGVNAAYGALWERAGQIQPRFTDWAGHFYTQFLQDYAKQREPRYDGLAVWVKARLHALYPNSVPPPIPEESASDISALMDEASLAEYRERYDDSAAILTRAIEQVEHWQGGHSALAMLLIRRASMYQEAKDWDLAQKDCRRVVALEPHTGQAYLCLADTESDEAAERRDYALAFQYDPSLRRAEGRLGVLLEKSDPKRALRLMQEANEIGTPDGYLLQEIAKQQNASGDYSKALISVSEAIAIDPEDATSYQIKQDAEKGLGRSSIEISLDSAADNRRLAEYLARTGRPGDALKLYLESLHTLAGIAGAETSDSIRAEETVTAHEVSQLLESMGSHNDARQFWIAVNTTQYLKPLGQVAQQEIQRLSTP
jgi:tetratricopeptide (TPR) repeat protein/energy-coupling factor transporter ATP-binding protein EcfA2